MISGIEAAANIWWGESFDLEKQSEDFLTRNTFAHNDENPETIYMAKEMLTSLSKEAKDVLNMIMNSPEEMFLGNDKLSQMALRRILRKKGWSWKRVLSVQRELKDFCRGIL